MNDHAGNLQKAYCGGLICAESFRHSTEGEVDIPGEGIRLQETYFSIKLAESFGLRFKHLKKLVS